ncbi:hypothetical protein [Nostoc parmelioides]|uniref:hypothetical protein n=1 Tax=Nostoc parmelioides TaxID=1521621 RepID=UPI00168A3394|nr:hypothetical protein [Nostoc parmelioides]
MTEQKKDTSPSLAKFRAEVSSALNFALNLFMAKKRSETTLIQAPGFIRGVFNFEFCWRSLPEGYFEF